MQHSCLKTRPALTPASATSLQVPLHLTNTLTDPGCILAVLYPWGFWDLRAFRCLVTLARHGCIKDHFDESPRFMAYFALLPVYSHKPGASSYTEPVISTSIKHKFFAYWWTIKGTWNDKMEKNWLKFNKKKKFQCLVIEVCPKLEIRILKTRV